MPRMTELEALFAIQDGLPRNGPGSDALTLEALRRLGPLPARPRVLDVGCGVGRSTLALARALGPGARVTGVDLHAPFLAELARAAEAEGLGSRVAAREQSMDALSDAPASVDLLWSEGSAFILGFERALASWKPLLAAGGRSAVSECSWLTSSAPDEAAAFFARMYPAMGTVEQNVARAERAGYSVLGTIDVPRDAWWDEYYTPMLVRLAALREPARSDPALAAAVSEAEREIALHRRCGESYGYVFFLLAGRETRAGAAPATSPGS